MQSIVAFTGKLSRWVGRGVVHQGVCGKETHPVATAQGFAGLQKKVPHDGAFCGRRPNLIRE
jgi:hypothetical protein